MKPLSLISLLWLLAGCSANRAAIDADAFAPKDSGSLWSAERPTPSRPASSFSKAEVPTGPLSLATIVDVALQNNPQTRLTWAKARVAAAQYGQSQSTQFPDLSATYDYERIRTITTTSVVGSLGTEVESTAQKFYYSQWGPQLHLTYTLLDFGQRQAQVSAAKQALIFADYTHNREIQTVLNQVSQDYYNLIYERDLLQAVEENLITAETTFAAAKLELDSGTKSLSDLLEAESRLLQAKISLFNQRQKLLESQATLSTHMGVSAHEKIEIEETPTVPPVNEMLQSADQLLTLALQKRSDLLAAEAQVHQAEENILYAKRQFFPTLGYSLAFGETSYSKTGSDHYDFTSAFTLSVPIFSGFSLVNNLRSAKAKKAAAEARLREAELQVIQEITVSHANVKTAFDTLSCADDLLKASERQYDVAIARYRAGTGNILEVVSAQSNLADARARQVGATSGWLSALIDLSYAVGTLSPPVQKRAV
jgi:outer membrane protein TolC